MLQTEKITYQDGEDTLEGYYACRKDHEEKKPIVIVVHDWSGRNEFACKKVDALADLGYVGLAIDMYGNAKIGNTKEEKSSLIQPFINDRNKLLQRLMAAITVAKTLPNVNANKIGAIGFCFGGLCVLDLARSGIDVKGVVSFHGLLNPPTDLKQHTIRAQVLALHGFDDPMATPEQAIEFGHEMTRAKANWELVMYGNTKHAFTNPEANDPDFGTVYNKPVADRAWMTMKQFFTDVFA